MSHGVPISVGLIAGSRPAERERERPRGLVRRAHRLAADAEDVGRAPEDVVGDRPVDGEVRVPGLEDGHADRGDLGGAHEHVDEPRIDAAREEVLARAVGELDARIGRDARDERIGDGAGGGLGRAVDGQRELERGEPARRRGEQRPRRVELRGVAAAVGRGGTLDVGDPLAPARGVGPELGVAGGDARGAHRERVVDEPAQLELRPREVAGVIAAVPDPGAHLEVADAVAVAVGEVAQPGLGQRRHDRQLARQPGVDRALRHPVRDRDPARVAEVGGRLARHLGDEGGGDVGGRVVLGLLEDLGLGLGDPQRLGRGRGRRDERRLRGRDAGEGERAGDRREHPERRERHETPFGPV